MAASCLANSIPSPAEAPVISAVFFVDMCEFPCDGMKLILHAKIVYSVASIVPCVRVIVIARRKASVFFVIDGDKNFYVR